MYYTKSKKPWKSIIKQRTFFKTRQRNLTNSQQNMYRLPISIHENIKQSCFQHIYIVKKTHS
jgi:hypothetical protein